MFFSFYSFVMPLLLFKVPGRGELCSFLVSQQRATKKILDQIVGPHAGQEGGKSKTRINISIQRGKYGFI